MPKDLRKQLDSIESSEKEIATIKAKSSKLAALVERQKRIIGEQEGIIEEQKAKISKMSDVPEDILELKELIGAQRQIINEKELELEYAKGGVAQSQKEMELVKKQIIQVYDLFLSHVFLKDFKSKESPQKIGTFSMFTLH